MNNQINIIKKGRPKTIDLERIKNVAMINYWSDGPTNVSLNEICFKAKISKPGLYREFGGDETLDLLIAFVIGNKDEEHIKKGCLLAKFRQSREKFGEKTQEQIDIILRERYLNFELWIKKAKSKGEFDFPLSSKFVARYIISQLDYAVSGLANGENNNNIKDVLTLSLSVFRKK